MLTCLPPWNLGFALFRQSAGRGVCLFASQIAAVCGVKHRMMVLLLFQEKGVEMETISVLLVQKPQTDFAVEGTAPQRPETLEILRSSALVHAVICVPFDFVGRMMLPLEMESVEAVVVEEGILAEDVRGAVPKGAHLTVLCLDSAQTQDEQLAFEALPSEIFRIHPRSLPGFFEFLASASHCVTV